MGNDIEVFKGGIMDFVPGPKSEEPDGKEEKNKRGNGSEWPDAFGPEDNEIRTPIGSNGKDPGEPKEGVPA